KPGGKEARKLRLNPRSPGFLASWIPYEFRTVFQKQILKRSTVPPSNASGSQKRCRRFALPPQSTTRVAMLCLLSALSFTQISHAATSAASAPITVRTLKLSGDLNHDRAAFILNAVIKVDNSKGGSLELLSGAVALTELGAHPKWRIRT